MEIFSVLLLQYQFYKYTILKVSERVRVSLEEPDAEVQLFVTDNKNTSAVF